jgi:enoyl-CoA hydratase
VRGVSEFNTIRFIVQDSVARITMNRPDKLNAINPAMIGELHAAMDLAEADDAVRVIVLDGEGRAFSAGFDLSVEDPSGDNSEEFWREDLQRDFDVIMRFWNCPKPTVAAVHGYCLGSAMEIAVVCDITVTSDDCRFGAPEVKFGSGIVALVLPWLISAKAATELLLTGDDKVTAERALAIGLVNRVVERGALEQASLDFAMQLSANDLTAMRLTKQAIIRSYQIMGMPQALTEALKLDVIIESTPTETPEESS